MWGVAAAMPYIFVANQVMMCYTCSDKLELICESESY